MADLNRQRKVADRIKQTVAHMLERRVKDPRLGFITITDVRVTGDLQHATVFYTVYGSEKEARDTAAALESAKGMLRSAVGKALGIRLTPTLEFAADGLAQSAARMEEVLAAARAEDERLAEQARGAKYAGDADPYRDDPAENS
ncbi:30S ribosome-binding factor RbfA [Gleimia hominis]|uniref:Ribosome-binding factor A n=1 Tax=Gleimia hominis TaxID=595468 RepID=A0ABU3IAV9_9ACTO|nr:30S ribosome-binding factor RbfA [Gleimia hominis]MDT3767505.1 30S ribosome-binding factor RbfA [Gleimia hominis]WIK64923.1 30S ribosome-binding factor RbfA [Gleimia hominis]